MHPEKDATSLNKAISIDEVKSAVYKAKIRKAKGIDEIPSGVLKNPLCINMLHKLMSLAFEQGMVPQDWNRGIIHPIPKSSSNDPTDPLCYRGISLISIPCKIYCMVLTTRLTKWMEANKVLAEEQNGFWQNRSCLDHLYTLNNIIGL